MQSYNPGGKTICKYLCIVTTLCVLLVSAAKSWDEWTLNSSSRGLWPFSQGPSVPFAFEFDYGKRLALLKATVPGKDMTACWYSFQASVRDSDGLFSVGQLAVSVQVQLSPKGYPQFSQQHYAFSLPENSHTAKFMVEAYLVKEQNPCLHPSLSNISYALNSEAQVHVPFTVSRSGSISPTASIDYETAPRQYNFSVVASNAAGLSSQAQVTITVEDVNEYVVVITVVKVCVIIICT